ncbi:MAG TPA: hypothetical protein DCP25_12775 [Chloroflexi bacterium]|jgi:hypothetical protein|nr:hypothetical protein [Chloroflexota bacterium]
MTVELQVWHVVIATAVVALVVGIGIGHFALPTASSTPKEITLSVKPSGPTPDQQAAQDSDHALSNVRAAVPGIEAYNADNSAGYTGLTVAQLVAYDTTIEGVEFVGQPTSTSYCVMSTGGSQAWYKQGPGADITTTPCTGP